jgi:hypothetical protein
MFISHSIIKNLGQKFGKGLDQVHPFSETPAVDIIIRDAKNILSPNLDAVGSRHAGRIWGFVSKFVMLDRFGAALGSAKVNPGLPVPRMKCSPDYFGTASKVIKFLIN